MKSVQCKTQWHVIVAHLWRLGTWQPTHLLQSIDTGYGFIGSSGEQRARELARNDPKVVLNHPELANKVKRERGAAIGLDPRYEYFRFVPQVSPAAAAQERCRRFDAGFPAEQVMAI